jgi:hypothetical protein
VNFQPAQRGAFSTGLDTQFNENDLVDCNLPGQPVRRAKFVADCLPDDWFIVDGNKRDAALVQWLDGDEESAKVPVFTLTATP